MAIQQEKQNGGRQRLKRTAFKLFIAAIFLWILSPRVLIAGSPDKRYTAVVVSTNFICRLLIPSAIHTVVIDRTTYERVMVRRDSGSLFGGYYPQTILWRPEEEHFACVSQTPDMGVISVDSYAIHHNPLRLQDNDSSWVRGEVQRLASTGSARERATAKRLLPHYWMD
jgi:hypothetical protein